MSRRGEWKTLAGATITIPQMEDDHLRNSLRYLYRKITELSRPEPDLPTPPVPNVIGEVEKVIGAKLKKQVKKAKPEKVERNISFDL